MLSDHRRAHSIKHFALKIALRNLLNRFGIYVVNEKLSEIFYEEAKAGNDRTLDAISEAYENINNILRFKGFTKTKPQDDLMRTEIESFKKAINDIKSQP